MKKKQITISIAIITILAFGGLGYWYTQIKVPYNEAVKAFDTITISVQDKNTELQKSINESELLIDSDPEVLDEKVTTNLNSSISTAKKSMIKIPEIPKKKIDIQNATDKLSVEIDYTPIIQDLTNKTNDVLNSTKQLAQVSNPTEEFITLRLEPLEDIIELKAVTEDNDPNGNLNKPGGYTATIYFSSNKVDQRVLFGNDLIDKGTEAGGAIEVYPTKEDAERRNEFLAAFDGGMLSAGSHSTIGTVVIRTSDKLTATQQKELEEDIFNALTRLD